MIEQAKAIVESITGMWVPTNLSVRRLTRPTKPVGYKFLDDGKTPNNPKLPLLVYRKAVTFGNFDPAAVLEKLFLSRGWADSWRDGVYTFNHFHTRTHEVIGVARGFVKVLYGGARGKVLRLEAGDIVVHPAGVGHKRVGGSKDLLVVGAYPAGGEYDEPRATKSAHDLAVARISKVRAPPSDPVYGRNGPLKTMWR